MICPLQVLRWNFSLAVCHSKTPTQFDHSIIVYKFAIQLNFKCSEWLCETNVATHTHTHSSQFSLKRSLNPFDVWHAIRIDTYGKYYVYINSEKKSNLPISIQNRWREWRRHHIQRWGDKLMEMWFYSCSELSARWQQFSSNVPDLTKQYGKFICADRRYHK